MVYERSVYVHGLRVIFDIDLCKQAFHAACTAILAVVVILMS